MRAFLIFFLIGGATLAPSPTAELQRFEFSEPHMGTMVRLALYAADETQARRAARAAFDRIAALDRALSDYRPDSELSRLSARAGSGPVAVSEDLGRVLDAGQRLAEESGGAFDVTVGPLSALWREARHNGRLPGQERLAAARARVGYRHLHVDRRARTATLDLSGMRLDLGGIGKGYAAEQALNTLGAHGISRALVAAGGDITVGDPPPDRSAWAVDVALPQQRRRLLLRNAAVSTSGDAEQFVVIDGVRYSHIVDPRVGLGLTTSRQATVVAPRGIAADGLATAVCVLGADRGLSLIDRHDRAAALVVTRAGGDFEVRASARWSALVEVQGSRSKVEVRGCEVAGKGEEGRGTRDEGRGTRDEGRGKREEGRGKRGEVRETREESTSIRRSRHNAEGEDRKE